MLHTRGKFLLGMAMVSVSLGAWALSPTPQRPGASPTHTEHEPPDAPAPTKAMLEANDKEMKKKVEKLYQLAGELKESVEKTDSAQVLSLEMVKKAEEIEKLAREIKTRSKG